MAISSPNTIIATGTARRKLNAIVQPTVKQIKGNHKGP